MESGRGTADRRRRFCRTAAFYQDYAAGSGRFLRACRVRFGTWHALRRGSHGKRRVLHESGREGTADRRQRSLSDTERHLSGGRPPSCQRNKDQSENSVRGKVGAAHGTVRYRKCPAGSIDKPPGTGGECRKFKKFLAAAFAAFSAAGNFTESGGSSGTAERVFFNDTISSDTVPLRGGFRRASAGVSQ